MNTITANPIYDLSNHHLRNVKLTLSNGNTLEGQFVQFKVIKGEVGCLYPAEKYCFLLKKDEGEFWYNYNRHEGEFPDFPPHVIQLGLNEIRKIEITPLLI